MKSDTKSLLCLVSFASVFILASCIFTKEELFHQERNDLIKLRDSLSSIVNLHSNWTGPPCYMSRSRWLGVTCSGSNVVGIVLEGIQLTGSLTEDALQNVTYLANLNLRNNALHGNLPNLKGLVYLQQVDFSLNRFSGPIPNDFTILPRLDRLQLQDNLINGTIPPFKQSGLTSFNVSYNFLEGSVPETDVLERFPKSSFDHNLELCGKALGKPCNVAPPVAPAVPPHRPAAGGGQAGGRSSGHGRGPASPPVYLAPSRHFRLGAWSLVLIAIGAALVPFLLLCSFLYYHRRHNKAKLDGGILDFTEKAAKSAEIKEQDKSNELEFFNKEKAVFDLDALLRSSAVVIGKGGLGITYRVTLESGPVAVVKRLRNMSGVSRKEFVQQLQLLGRLRHENLVEIVSYSYSKEEKLVIYEYLPGCSLFQLLHDNRGTGTPLKWAARLSIVKSIARGMAYLHQCLPFHKVPHANLKSSNIQVFHSYQKNHYLPKITDFGFQPLLPHMHKLAVAKAPEFLQGKKLTYKSDVYCFGLLVLEVVTGKVPSESQEEIAMPQWVRLALKNEWSTDILDLEIVGEKESHRDMLKLTEIALECTDLEPDRRPKMSEVVKKIEEIKEPRKERSNLIIEI